MIFYTADTHFGHENIIKFCDRPFSSVGEMDEALIHNWNDRVTANDTVFILGDMFFRSRNEESILKRLRGKKRLLIGNHDENWMRKDFDWKKYFESVDMLLETTVETSSVTLCHYPMLTWKRPRKSYMIHGHLHNDQELDYWEYLRDNDHILNAGVDVCDYTPVTFEELVAYNEVFKKNIICKKGNT